MQHNAAFHHGLAKKASYNIFRNYKRTPLDVCNGLSKVYCIRSERKIPLIYEGFRFMPYSPFNNVSANHDISSAYKCSLVADIANKMNQNQTAPLGV